MNTLTSSTLVITLAFSIGASCAFGQRDTSSRWMICTRDLQLVEGVIIRANESQIVTADQFGIRTIRSTNDVFFAIPGASLKQSPLLGQATVAFNEPSQMRLIRLVDGQIVHGRIFESHDADIIHADLYSSSTMRGVASISLERIVEIAPDRAARTNPMTDNARLESDSITMINGDVLSGFIESVGPTTMIDTGRGVVDIDFDRTSVISLSNPVESVPGVYISTIDHLVLRASSFDFDFQHPLRVQIDGPSLGLETDARDVWIMDPNSAIGVFVHRATDKIVSLSSIQPESVEPTGNRDWTQFPTVIASHLSTPVLSTIDLHAPVKVVYEVPSGTTRFACQLSAPINTWTDCIATITAIGYDGSRTELHSSRLNADHATVEINTRLDNECRHLEFRIDPGEYGPIQDRVLIVNPRLFVESK